MPPTPSPSPILIQIVGGDGAPWWGVPVIAGAFLIIGALLGFWFNWLLEGRKARRELSQRFLDDIKAFASKLVLHADALISIADSRARTLGEEDHVLARKSTVTELDENWTALNAEADGIFAAQASLKLIAPESIINAGRSVAINAALLTVKAEDDLEVAQRGADLVSKYNKELQKEVRKFFGIKEEK